MNKRGELMTKEIIEIVLAAAGIVLMTMLMYSLIAPTFNELEKTSGAYFEDFLDLFR